MIVMEKVNSQDLQLRNRRVGLIVAAVILLYIGAVIGFIIAY